MRLGRRSSRRDSTSCCNKEFQMFSVQIDLTDIYQFADDIHVAANQVPFAAARTINDALFRAREDLSETVWPQHVSRRNPHYPSVVLHVDKATKGDLHGELRETRGT